MLERAGEEFTHKREPIYTNVNDKSLFTCNVLKKPSPLLHSIVPMNSGQNGLSSILSVIQPVTIYTILNNIKSFFKKCHQQTRHKSPKFKHYKLLWLTEGNEKKKLLLLFARTDLFFPM